MLENKTVPFSFVKAGVFYFTRRVPKDLDHHYTTGKISFSLRTRSAAVAKSRAQRAAQALREAACAPRLPSAKPETRPVSPALIC
ncbi:DUF6538 domain-containing protein [Ruegeria meonggei]|uniref:DUF6538 domain-containing protein n=1 Tax=Ruegeria meonggei TaxID=1446476 RepID=UPI00366BA9B4